MSDVEAKKKDDSRKRDVVALDSSEVKDAKDTTSSSEKSKTSSSKADPSREVAQAGSHSKAPVPTASNKPLMTLSLDSSESRQIYNTVVQNSRGCVNSIDSK